MGGGVARERDSMLCNIVYQCKIGLWLSAGVTLVGFQCGHDYNCLWFLRTPDELLKVMRSGNETSLFKN